MAVKIERVDLPYKKITGIERKIEDGKGNQLWRGSQKKTVDRS